MHAGRLRIQGEARETPAATKPTRETPVATLSARGTPVATEPVWSRASCLCLGGAEHLAWCIWGETDQHARRLRIRGKHAGRLLAQSRPAGRLWLLCWHGGWAVWGYPGMWQWLVGRVGVGLFLRVQRKKPP